MTDGSFIKVDSIGAFCITFDLHEAIIGIENQFLDFLRVAVYTSFTVFVNVLGEE